MKVLVGSTNPVKLNAVNEAFSKFFNEVEVIGLEAPSGVPAQPVNEESFTGAENRAINVKRIGEEKGLKANFFVGVEGGIINLHDKWFAFGCMCIIDDEGRKGFGLSPHFELSKDIANELLKGVELGVVMDRLLGEKDTKKKDGSIGYFTKGVMSRKDFYIGGLITALVPFINKDFYF